MDEDVNEEEEYFGVVVVCSGDNEDRDAEVDKNDNVVIIVGICDVSFMFLDVLILFVFFGVIIVFGFFIGYGKIDFYVIEG